MAVSASYRTFVEDLFSPILPISIRPMFGGAGIYSGELMFGLIVDERIYLRADEMTREKFLAENSFPFVFEARDGRKLELSYFELPDRLYEDPEELKEWALQAIAAAVRKKKIVKKPRASKARAKPKR